MFYYYIKTIERVKKQTIFQKKMADLKSKNSKTIDIKNV